jgi:hypothetical protein
MVSALLDLTAFGSRVFVLTYGVGQPDLHVHDRSACHTEAIVHAPPIGPRGLNFSKGNRDERSHSVA